MLKKRLIFTLFYDQGAFMLSRNFRLQKVGNMDWLQNNYDFSKVAFSIDELIVLDVSRTKRDLHEFCRNLKILSQGCFVPIAAGGGVRSIGDAKILLRSGADKIVINTPLFETPLLITELSAEFGQQCIVASIDAKLDTGTGYRAWIKNGSQCMEGTLGDWIKKLSRYPVGDLYLNSMDRDGTGQGYDMDILGELPDDLPMPLILSGGAGHYNHLSQGLSDKRIDAVATGHLFNFLSDGLERSRMELINKGFHLPLWDHLRAKGLKNLYSGNAH